MSGSLNASAEEWTPGGSASSEFSAGADSGTAAAAVPDFVAPDGSWPVPAMGYAPYAVADGSVAPAAVHPGAFDMATMYSQLAAMSSSMGIAPDAATLAALAGSLTGFAQQAFDPSAAAAAAGSDSLSQGGDDDAEEMRIQLELEKYRRFLVSESALFLHASLSRSRPLFASASAGGNRMDPTSPLPLIADYRGSALEEELASYEAELRAEASEVSHAVFTFGAGLTCLAP